MIAFLLTIEDEKLRSKLEEIYECYHKELFITAYSILKDYHEAEEVVQNMFIRIARNIEKISKIRCKKTRAYLVVIVRNLCYDVYNKKKGITYLPFEEISKIATGDEISLDDHVLRIEESDEIAKSLSKLYKPYADILMLRYYHQLSISEIASVLNITENNVSVRINRAIKNLKHVLEEGGVSFERKI